MFQTRLKELREAAGYKSQQSFADAFGVAQSTVGGWESGAREPKYETTIRLADFFDVSTDYLLGRESQLEKSPLVNNDEELTEVLEQFRNRSELRMLFSLTKGATKADVEKAAAIIEALRKAEGRG